MKNTINTVTWDRLISTFYTSGGPTTRERTFRKFKQKRWRLITQRPLHQTDSTDLLELLNLGGTQTNIYLAALQSLAVDTGILPHPILPKRLFPKRTIIPSVRSR